jgi:hypothetical protein
MKFIIQGLVFSLRKNKMIEPTKRGLMSSILGSLNKILCRNRLMSRSSKMNKQVQNLRNLRQNLMRKILAFSLGKKLLKVSKRKFKSNTIVLCRNRKNWSKKKRNSSKKNRNSIKLKRIMNNGLKTQKMKSLGKIKSYKRERIKWYQKKMKFTIKNII